VSLIAPATKASAQYRYYDRPSYDHRQMPQRPAQSVRPPQTDARSSSKTATAPVAPKPAAPINPGTPVKKPVEQVAKPVLVAPLTEEQIAAKAAVDELLAREPALSAAKERPDPALARAAAAKHDAEDRKLAALKAKQEAGAVKLRDMEQKNKAREE